jgi:nucleoside-diphosphate-sugar epimerase
MIYFGTADNLSGDSMMGNFAFVAGATGAAATRLIEELLRQNWRMIAISRKTPTKKANANLTYLQVDLLDADGLKLCDFTLSRHYTSLFYCACLSRGDWCRAGRGKRSNAA